ncbi:MAG: hypothetical protein RIQ41_345 [Candidatus Parcubacteria bacterium]|jgi:predicted Rossmann fold flavoprotein
MNNTTSEHKTVWDVVVIGGGPSGMMAAGKAASRGKSVLLLEKNTELGKKLLITGGGRCNITNNKPDTRTLLSKYKGNDQFLFSAFSQWSVADTLTFFNTRGVPTKEENEGRIFPVSNTSQSVYDVLYAYMKEHGVQIHKSSIVSGIKKQKEGEGFLITTKSGNTVSAHKVIIATGGTSRPETGSTGDGFAWLKKLQHTVIENDFALVPISLSDLWTKKLSGVTLSDIKLTTFQNDKKQDSYKGKLLFTHVGISGPTVLGMSKDVGELLKYGDVVISLDLFPSKDEAKVKRELQTILIAESNKKLKNVLPLLVPSSLVAPLLSQTGIDGETFSHSVRSEDRTTLSHAIKNIPLHVKSLLGKEKAIVSSGGIPLTEIDMKTMESNIVPGLYLTGDVLNIDRPSGGYSLQLCWTTGFVAGSNC